MFIKILKKQKPTESRSLSSMAFGSGWQVSNRTARHGLSGKPQILSLV